MAHGGVLVLVAVRVMIMRDGAQVTDNTACGTQGSRLVAVVSEALMTFQYSQTSASSLFSFLGEHLPGLH